MNVLIGIDDTDNRTSRGTGFRARDMAKHIHENRLGKVSGITRHQLFVAPQIPYTSQNSSACLHIEAIDCDTLQRFCINYLLQTAVDGADIGFCMAEEWKIGADIISWGQRAKKEVLTQNEAKQLAQINHFVLKGLTGTKDGIIGALAAVGLRKSGDDGRFIFLQGKELRELKGFYYYHELKNISNIDEIKTKQGAKIPENARLDLGDWVRPVLQNNKSTLIVEHYKNGKNESFRVSTKEYIKSISD